MLLGVGPKGNTCYSMPLLKQARALFFLPYWRRRSAAASDEAATEVSDAAIARVLKREFEEPSLKLYITTSTKYSSTLQ